MNEKRLKKFFALMYKKLSELAIGDGFFRWMRKRRNITFKKVRDKGDNYLFEKLILTIFSGGFRSRIVDAKWPSIKKAFDNFNIQKIADYDEEKITRLTANSNIIRHPTKIKATVNNAKKVIEILRQYGSFANYLNSYRSLLILAQDLVEEFDFLGRETVWDFLKDIGFEAIKPDVHVRRILFRLGLISSEESSPETTKEVFEVAKKMSEATGGPLGVIDSVLWFYGADRPREIRKPICGAEPVCSECYLTEYCRYFNEKYGAESEQ